MGDSFYLVGKYSPYLFSHLLTDSRHGRRMAEPKSDTVSLNDTSFLFSDASELVFLFCLHLFSCILFFMKIFFSFSMLLLFPPL